MAQKGNTATLLGLFLVIVAFAFYSLLVKPLAAEVEVAKNEITQKAQEVDSLKNQISAFVSAEEEYSLVTEVQKNQSLEAVPLAMDQDEVIRDVIEISDKYDIELTSISFGRVSGVLDGVDGLRVNASFVGGNDDLVDFLEGLESNRRLFKIVSISVQLDNAGLSQSERANFSLVLETYFQTDLSL